MAFLKNKLVKATDAGDRAKAKWQSKFEIALSCFDKDKQKESEAKGEAKLIQGLKSHIEAFNIAPEECRMESVKQLYMLGLMFRQGTATIKANVLHAISCFHLIAQEGKGPAGACYQYACCLQEQKRSDPSEIVRYYEFAANKKEELFPAFLADMYERGCGVTKDLYQAFLAYKVAADKHKHPFSQHKVAFFLYEQHQSGVRDVLLTAKTYCEKAVANGCKDAEVLLPQINEAMKKNDDAKSSPPPEPSVVPRSPWFEDVVVVSAVADAQQLFELDNDALPFNEALLRELDDTRIQCLTMLEMREKEEKFVPLPAKHFRELSPEELSLREAVHLLQLKLLAPQFKYKEGELPTMVRRHMSHDDRAITLEELRKIRCSNAEVLNIPHHFGAFPFHTPLTLAVGYEDPEQVEFLVKELKVDVNAPSFTGYTSLHQACLLTDKMISAKIIKFLLSEGADVNAVDNNGETPLHKCGLPTSVDLIVKKGGAAALMKRNAQNETPLKKLVLHYDHHCYPLLQCLLKHMFKHHLEAHLLEILVAIADSGLELASKQQLIAIIRDDLDNSLQKTLPVAAFFLAIIENRFHAVDILAPFYAFEVYRIFGLLLEILFWTNEKRSNVLEKMKEDSTNLFAVAALAKRLDAYTALRSGEKTDCYLRVVAEVEKIRKNLFKYVAAESPNAMVLAGLYRLLDEIRVEERTITEAILKLAMDESELSLQISLLDSQILLTQKTLLQLESDTQKNEKNLDTLLACEERMKVAIPKACQAIAVAGIAAEELVNKSAELARLTQENQQNSEEIKRTRESLLSWRSKITETQEHLAHSERERQSKVDSQLLLTHEKQAHQQIQKNRVLYREQLEQCLPYYHEKVDALDYLIFLRQRGVKTQTELQIRIDAVVAEKELMYAQNQRGVGSYSRNRIETVFRSERIQYLERLIDRRRLTLEGLMKFLQEHQREIAQANAALREKMREMAEVLANVLPIFSHWDVEEKRRFQLSFETMLKNDEGTNEVSEASESLGPNEREISQSSVETGSPHSRSRTQLFFMESSASADFSSRRGLRSETWPIFFASQRENQNIITLADVEIVTQRDNLPDVGAADSFYEIDVPGDGSCWLYAIVLAVLLPKLNSPQDFRQNFTTLFGGEAEIQKYVEENRQLLCKYDGTLAFIKENDATYEVLVERYLRPRLAACLAENQDELIAFLPAGGFNQLMIDIVKPYTPGDNVQLVGVSLLLKRPILIYHESVSGIALQKPVAGDRFSDVSPIRLLFLPDKRHYHYFIESKYVNWTKTAKTHGL